jgi:hypothetical protein
MTIVADALSSIEAGTIEFLRFFAGPGMGKTRLCDEVAERARLDGRAVARTALQPGDSMRPLSLFADLFRQMRSMPGALGCSSESLSWLERLSGRTSVESQADLGEVARAMKLAIDDLFDAISSEASLLLIIDDVQWIDSASKATLENLRIGSDSLGILIVLSGRECSAFEKLSADNRRFRQFELLPIKDDACIGLVSSQLRTHEDASFAKWLAETSGGNPFFLSCLIAEFLRTGERYSVPRRMTDLVDKSISGVSASGRQLLSVIVRLGHRVTIGRLNAATAMSHTEQLSAVRELERAHLIRSDDSGVRVAHWLVSESEYRLSSNLAAGLVHLRIADVLDQELHAGGDPTLVWDISQHLVAAGETQRAATTRGLCAEQAMSLGRPREAIEQWLQAASLAVGESRRAFVKSAFETATRCTEIDLVIKARDLFRQDLGTEPDSLQLVAIAASIQLERETTQSFETLLSVMSDKGRSIVDRGAAATTYILACDIQRLPHLVLSRSEEIHDIWTQLASVEHAEAIKLELIYSCTVSELPNVPSLARQLLKLARNAGADAAADLFRKAGIGFWRCGMTSEGLAALTRSYELADKAGLLRLRNLVATMLSGLLHDLGRFDAADEWLSIAQQHHWEAADLPHEFLRIAICGDRAVREDDIIELTKLVAQALRIASPAPRILRWVKSLEVYIRQRRGATVDLPLRELEVFESMVPQLESGEGSDFEVGMLAQLCLAAGDTERASTAMTRYLTIYRRPGMPANFILRRTCDQLGLTALMKSATEI